MGYLRKLCCTFDILPSSFILTFDKRESKPLAMGGFSDVYEAALDGRPVAVKVLRIPNTETVESVRKVGSMLLPPLNGSLTLGPKLFVREVVGWKWLRHENILPFVGVLSKPPLFSIISERMENGNIRNFIKVRPNHNRLHLVSKGRVHVPHHTNYWDIACRCSGRIGIPAQTRYHPWRPQRGEPLIFYRAGHVIY